MAISSSKVWRGKRDAKSWLKCRQNPQVKGMVSFIPAAFIVDVIFVVVVADVCMLRLAFYGYFFTYKRITLSLLVSSKSNIWPTSGNGKIDIAHSINLPFKNFDILGTYPNFFLLFREFFTPYEGATKKSSKLTPLRRSCQSSCK